MGSTIVFGIPVPSTAPFFLGIVIIHIALGICAVIASASAMLSRKERGKHSTFGTTYFWALGGVFATMTVLSFIRWSEDYHLFILGFLSFGAVCFGRRNIRRKRPRWHLAGMGVSYILMLTAFYVDNGKNLPLWNKLPQIAFWFVPGAIGLPLLAYYVFRLPRFKL